ncbi:MAG TPA: hypothetical protein VFK05_23170 [Polyangiaceae bacterium]|nr:hypothetical protein [Polyangiaceae bacterium]
MLLGVRCLAVCAVAAYALSPRLARAQADDSLPTMDDSEPAAPAPAPEPAAPPPPVVVVDPSQKRGRQATGPIRAQRRLALTGEVGWNGLAGFGPNLTFRAHPNLSFDLGAGLGLVGWKVGLRARYLLLKGPVTPFIGAGIIAASGFGSAPLELSNAQDDPGRVPLNVKILPSTWLQSVAGVDWVAGNGFTLIGTAGWASVLSGDPVQVVTGTPSHDEEQALNAIFRSSIVFTIALGYSFR